MGSAARNVEMQAADSGDVERQHVEAADTERSPAACHTCSGDGYYVFASVGHVVCRTCEGSGVAT